MYASLGAEQRWLSVSAGSAYFLLNSTLSSSSSPSSASSYAWTQQGGRAVAVVTRRMANVAFRGINGDGSSSRSGMLIPGKLHLHRLQARSCESGFPTRAAHSVLLHPPSSVPGRALKVTAAALTGGINTEETVKAALTDFILDGSKATTIAHKVWQGVVQAGDTVIDATCGNGHDTLMLARLVLQGGTAGCVIGLDLQQSALDNTTLLLNRELTSSQRDKVNLLQLCHSQLDKVVDENSVRLVAFNLGYQPGGNKSLITRADTTVKALGAAVNVLEKQGLISIMSYVGHPGGREEYEAIREFVAGLPSNDWVCSHLEWINRPLCPHLMFLLKK